MPKTSARGPGELAKIPKNELVDVEELLLDPSNPQDHPADSIEAIAASLAEYGQQKPVVYDERGVLIAGHGTVEAARALGWSKIWAVRSDLEGAKRVGYQIADNQTSKRAVWNENLGTLLRALREEGAGMDALGFSAEELVALMTEVDPEFPDGDPRAEPAIFEGRLVEIRCPDEFLAAIQETLDGWSSEEGVEVHVS